ncbi:ATP-dependent Clp protease proteolytic subunit [Pseudomonas sp. 21LCFQ010]|uniref:SDH family Clp fold serine proteinase n=1 Tax=Pseudomonas sp. 21LCFQ010 TaxID=2957506 RepID=UPI002096ED5E|nr:ATP-dependent Clp protease proteolytic subunit [Pseudomonas sp. 21LCFQ010]MCO8160997.1 ATP-dependent Clp protease proteolytic subunit [Pseudomonas sp. 21LCFQ010]
MWELLFGSLSSLATAKKRPCFFSVSDTFNRANARRITSPFEMLSLRAVSSISLSISGERFTLILDICTLLALRQKISKHGAFLVLLWCDFGVNLVQKQIPLDEVDVARSDEAADSSLEPSQSEVVKPHALSGPPQDSATDGHSVPASDVPDGVESSNVTEISERSLDAAPDDESRSFSAEKKREEPPLAKQLAEIATQIDELRKNTKPNLGQSGLLNLLKAVVVDANTKPRKNAGSSSEPYGDEPASAASTEEVIAQKPNRDAQYVADFVEREKGKGLGDALKREVLKILGEHPVLANYDVVFLYDHNQINRLHAGAIYQRLSGRDKKKDIFLILKSPGGEVESAYLISKMCNRYKDGRFVVGVPAEAKSAATLLSLGADEIHMGAMSELGPIDPQINDFPALAFSGALERITKLAHEYPGAANMLSQYLIGSSLDVRALGHYERITESATQYALRLLKSKVTSTEVDLKQMSALAEHFTNHYKDHNFVIDLDEARELFGELGEDVVKSDTDLYKACHEVHRFIELSQQVCAVKNVGGRLIIIGDNYILR